MEMNICTCLLFSTNSRLSITPSTLLLLLSSPPYVSFVFQNYLFSFFLSNVAETSFFVQCVLPAGVQFYSSGFDSNDPSTFPRSYPIVLTGMFMIP